MTAETAHQVRMWLEHLGLSDTEGAEALDLGNPEVVMREYKSDKRTPGPPTLKLMEMTVRLADALILLRAGRAMEARTTLESMCTPALFRRVQLGHVGHALQRQDGK